MATSEDFVIILDKTQAEQRTFFQQNVSDQFRGWTIANNKPNPSYFDPWDNPDASEDNYFRIDPNYQSQSVQRTFFQQNVSEQFRGWTIANNKPNPQFFTYKVPGPNNLIIDSATSSLDSNNIKNILSFSFPESMVTSSHSKLLSVAYKKISGNITFEVNNDHTNILGPPSGSVPSLADTTYFSINNGNVIALMEDYSVVPSDATELLNQSNGLIVFYTGVSLTADTPIKFAQLTMTNTSSGVLEVTYADSSRPDEYQNHTLNVTDGIIASA